MRINIDSLKESISEKRIINRIKEIAHEITKTYLDESPIFIGILKGSFIFIADLIREMDIDCEIDFIQVSSYSGTSSKGLITFKKDIRVCSYGTHS